MATLNARIKATERELEVSERDKRVLQDKLQDSIDQVQKTLNECNSLRHENTHLQKQYS